uniref:Glycerophosphodiester phosphodiesterase n=1 Tax=Haptolina ericina TaxID=156174 RepID=A0A7S3FIV3_9EUKA|mmetsp:Transcript_72674/g.161497  ORF Transcript_72674/g.161497 Transcript_72674/m.161497 type:complete len:146 (+) Transcript_72674:675-1112(+)
MHSTIASSGIAHQLGVVVESSAGAAVHRAAQAEAGTRVELFGLLRDFGASRDSAGRPHANLSALALEGSLYDGWSASIKLLHPELVEATREQSKPLSVWVADTEAELRRAWTLKAESVISNRPRWAQQLMAAWLTQCNAGEVQSV